MPIEIPYPLKSGKYESASRVMLYGIVMALFLLSYSGYAHLASDINGKVLTRLSSMLSNTIPVVVSIAIEKFISKLVDPFQSETEQDLTPMKVPGVGSGVIIDAQRGLYC